MRLALIGVCLLGLVLGFIAAISFPAQARDKILDIRAVKSPGGIEAWLVEDHSIPVIALHFSFKGAGAVNDPPDKQGLAKMVSNTLDEGAGELDSQAFQKELRDRVIGLYFSSDRDNFGGTVKTLTKNKSRAFELLQMALTTPRFDAEPVERMRKANQGRIRSSLTEPEWMAARILNDVAFSGHSYAQNSGGTLRTLENITIDDLRGFTKQLSQKNLYVTAAGDIGAEELASLLDQVFGALPVQADLTPAPDIAIQNQGELYLYEQDIPQTIIEMIQPGIKRSDPDYQTAQVMNYILGSAGFGSRLTKEIREKRGLTYGVYSHFMEMDHAHGLSVSTSTQNSNVAQMLPLIQEEWKKMATAPVTEDELKSAKSYLTGSLPLSLTSTDDVASLLLSLKLDGLPIDYLDQRQEKIQATTIDDVSRVAKRLLDPAGFVTVLVGKPEGINNAKIIETLPNAE